MPPERGSESRVWDEEPGAQTNALAASVRPGLGDPLPSDEEVRDGSPADDESDIAAQRLGRPVAVIAVGTLLSRVTGVGRTLAMIIALGVTESRLGDTYTAANTLPVTLYELFLGGVLAASFIPVIVEELRTSDQDKGWRAISAIVTTAITVLTVVTIVVIVAAPLVMEAYAARVPGTVREEWKELATFFLRIFAAQIALYGVAAVATALLNAHGRFAVPAFTPILNNLVLICFFLAFTLITSGAIQSNASVSDDPELKLLLGAGATLGVAAMAIGNWLYMRRLPGRLRAAFQFRHPAVVKLVRLSSWTFLYVIVTFVGLQVSNVLATSQQGGIQAYGVAFQFFQLPFGIAAMSILTALTPRLAVLSLERDDAGFRASLAGGWRATALVLVPCTAAYLALSEPIVRILIEYVNVSAESAQLVADVLRMFAIGLLPFATFMLLTRAFYTRQDGKRASLVTVIGVGTTIALDFLLFPSMHVEGLALANALGYIVGSILAGTLLASRIGGLELTQSARELAKILTASGLAFALILSVSAGVSAVLEPGKVRDLAQIVLGGGAGLSVFLLSARALRIDELETVRRFLPDRLRWVLPSG